jgi:hypothetical protein
MISNNYTGKEYTDFWAIRHRVCEFQVYKTQLLLAAEYDGGGDSGSVYF